jgi:hypothetical protein
MELDLPEPVQRYLHLLASREASGASPPTPGERMALAEEVGMDEAMMAQLRADVARYVDRGVAYSEVGQWEAARAELLMACRLDPMSPDTRCRLAEICAMQWRQVGQEAVRQEALAMLRQCEAWQAGHAPAVALGQQMARWRRQLWKFRVLKVLLALAMLAGGGLAWWWGAQVQWWPQASVAPADTLAYLCPSSVVVPSHLVGVAMQVSPVRIRQSVGEQGQVRLQYEYAGSVRSDSLELGKLACQVAFLDTAGKVLAVESFAMLDALRGDSLDHRLSLHPGDLMPFARKNAWGLVLRAVSGRVSAVQFRLQDARAQLVQGRFPKYPRLRLPWHEGRPYYVALRAYSRLDSLQLNPFDSLVTHQVQVALEHRGNKPCVYLKVQLAWQDEAGEVLQRQEVLLADTSQLPIMPGQQAVLSAWAYFKYPAYRYPKPFHRLQVSVVEAR